MTKIKNNKITSNYNKKPKIFQKKNKSQKKSLRNHKNDKNTNKLILRERKCLEDKLKKSKSNFCEYSSDSIKKNKFYERKSIYRGCFACDLGCRISRSGYSTMSYSPYNNNIRRREKTPLKYNIGKEEEYEYDLPYNTKINKTKLENDNNYYLIEE